MMLLLIIPPLTIKEGNIIKDHFNMKKLDELRYLKRSWKQWLVDFEQKKEKNRY